MVPYINVLEAVMKNWIIKEPDATLIVTGNKSRLQQMIDQLLYQLTKPNGFTTSYRVPPWGSQAHMRALLAFMDRYFLGSPVVCIM